MPKVLISDKLSESAVNVFKENKIETEYMPGLNHDELLKLIEKFDGLAVRSATKVNAVSYTHLTLPTIYSV